MKYTPERPIDFDSHLTIGEALAAKLHIFEESFPENGHVRSCLEFYLDILQQKPLCCPTAYVGVDDQYNADWIPAWRAWHALNSRTQEQFKDNAPIVENVAADGKQCNRWSAYYFATAVWSLMSSIANQLQSTAHGEKACYWMHKAAKDFLHNAGLYLAKAESAYADETRESGPPLPAAVKPAPDLFVW